MMKDFFSKTLLGSFVNNHFITNNKTSKERLCIVTRQPIGELSSIEKKDIPLSIISSNNTFLSYKKTSHNERINLLKKTYDLLLAHKDQLAKLIVSEMGKTITEAKKEVDYSAGYFLYFAELLQQAKQKKTPSKNPNTTLSILYEPVGVCAFITPWNFPLAMPSRKVAAALAAGCTCIVKPAPETPFTMLFLAQLLKKAGFPSGASQVLIGDEKTLGKAFLDSPLIRKLSFTGSTLIGKYLYKESSQTLKKLSLELGGLAPLIVFEDADLEKASSEALIAKFRNSGQSCIAASFFLIHKKVYKKFSNLLAEKIKKMKIGDPFCLSTEFSAHLHPESLKKAKRHLNDALKNDAQALLQTKDPSHPQVLIHCKKNLLLFQEETFSPIAALLSFSTEKEAIALANSTPFGLASYLFTENLSKAQRVIPQLEFGMIGLNNGAISSPEIPFGGVKESGFGREGGPQGLEDFLVSKAISLKN